MSKRKKTADDSGFLSEEDFWIICVALAYAERSLTIMDTDHFKETGMHRVPELATAEKRVKFKRRLRTILKEVLDVDDVSIFTSSQGDH